MTKTNDNNFSIQLKKMNLLDVKLNQPEQPLPDNTKFNFNLNIAYNVNENKEIANIITTVQVFHQDNKTLLGSIKSNCAIFIQNLANYIDENKKISLPDELITSLNSLAISTTRGMMFSEFRGTFLHDAVLPLLNPKNVMNKKE